MKLGSTEASPGGKAKAGMLMDPAMAKAWEDATRPLWVVSKDNTYQTIIAEPLEARNTATTKHLNLAALKLPAVALNFVLPPLIFLVASVPLCSVMRKNADGQETYFQVRLGRGVYVWVLIAAVPLILACLSFVRTRKKGLDTSWPMLSIVLFGAALITGTITGEMTWKFFMQPFYVIDSMKAYPNISPADVPGQQVMDAGRVHFSSTSKVDISMTMSFTDWNMYCIAPIVDTSVATMSNYDYWAVGIDCCNADDMSFRCGDIDSTTARSGLREINEAHRNYYRLAVQQAEAAYNIHSEHPIFFFWVQDPLKLVSFFYEDGFKHFMCACIMHFATNTAVLAAATVVLIRPQDTAGLATLGL
mmetsp:Transcript_58974/g.140808  ORF Transcript_58974/g.140808 Transcript_58974/m.140808 type:complete len:361 (-) Transcript_58974:161-1243(-)|eukprot:CAMPEP_0178413360 /NCGR_PEP_ID=MMETSP0689_2-20121128/22488_1 /TAXON_ID=160604 /ORGANISM="Amphidinium massartii, Strain CS-259" /LENGTH=360 /DNA_ID=CAMNT_0020034631 /DNA_START=86 /DNA_END=1168 /DNA_ORIENTATION=+